MDETYVGGKPRNMSSAKRKELAGTGRGPVRTPEVVGAKDRATNQVAAKVVKATDKENLQDFVEDHAADGATVYTDEAKAYEMLPFNHDGVESFWATVRRAYEGRFHKISPKHLNRCVQQFAGKHNSRDSGTLAQVTALVAGLAEKRLMYCDLIADNGLPSGARC